MKQVEKQSFILEHIKSFKKPFILCINGDSMAPVIKSGDHVRVIPYKKNSLKIGDIIVYKKFYDHLTVHRIQNIITMSSTRFYCQTKGDNNIEADSYKVFNHEIIGTVNLEGVNKNEHD